MKQPFNYIFMLFRFSLVFPILICKEDRAVKKMWKLIFFIFNVYLTLFIIFAMTTSSFVMISNIIKYLSMIAHRWIICFRMNQFKEIVNSLSKIKIKQFKYLFCMWAIMSTLLLMFVFVFTLDESIHSFCNASISIFGFSVDEPYPTIIHNFHLFQDIFNFIMVINTFSMFYISVCQHMRYEILNFTKMINQGESLNFEYLIKSYSRISSMVNKADNSLSIIMFFHTVYSATSMHYIITSSLRSGYITTIGKRIINCSYAIVTLSSFFAMAVSASLVSEASQDVGNKVKTLTPGSMRSAIQLQRLISLTDKDLCLTVWKIVSIRRNFTISTLGVFFTYIMLFDSLKLL